MDLRGCVYLGNIYYYVYLGNKGGSRMVIIKKPKIVKFLHSFRGIVARLAAPLPARLVQSLVVSVVTLVVVFTAQTTSILLLSEKDTV